MKALCFFFFRNAGDKLPSDSMSYPKTKRFLYMCISFAWIAEICNFFVFFFFLFFLLRDNNISATQAGVCTIGTGCKVDQFYIWVHYTLPIMETYNCNFLFVCLTVSCLSHFRFLCLYICSIVPFPCCPTHSHFLLCVIQFAVRPQMSDCCWTLCRPYISYWFIFSYVSPCLFYMIQKDEKICLHCPEDMRGVKCLLLARSTCGHYTGTLSFWLHGYKMPRLKVTPRTYFILPHKHFYVFV